jgi:DNA-directed RNA polymerase subunit M/transcription elongation factor TFIIS
MDSQDTLALSVRDREICGAIAAVASARMLPIHQDVIKKMEEIVFQQNGEDVAKYQTVLTQIVFALEHPALELSSRQMTCPADLLAALCMFRTRTPDKESENILQDTQVEEGFMTCKCGSRRIEWENKHTRSADEGATLFCACTDCGAKWRISA